MDSKATIVEITQHSTVNKLCSDATTCDCNESTGCTTVTTPGNPQRLHHSEPTGHPTPERPDLVVIPAQTQAQKSIVMRRQRTPRQTVTINTPSLCPSATHSPVGLQVPMNACVWPNGCHVAIKLLGGKLGYNRRRDTLARVGPASTRGVVHDDIGPRKDGYEFLVLLASDDGLYSQAEGNPHH